MAATPLKPAPRPIAKGWCELFTGLANVFCTEAGVVVDMELIVIVDIVPIMEEVDEAAAASTRPSEFLGYRSKSSLIDALPSIGGCWLHDSFMACRSKLSQC